jgi:hypothetical protein
MLSGHIDEIGLMVTHIDENGLLRFSGVGGWAGAIVSGKLDPRVGTGALGFVNALKDLPEHTTAGGTLYVFRLP